MIIKKSLLKKSIFFLGGLMLLSLLVFVIGPVMSVDAAVDPCGDGVCDTASENNDLCPEDCHCIDNGKVDPGEGCGCRDVLCEDEAPESTCGSPCEEGDTCGNGLTCAGGVCWDGVICAPLEPEPVVPGGDEEEGFNCTTYLTCNGAWHNHPVSGADSLAELKRLKGGGCISGWVWNTTQYVCHP